MTSKSCGELREVMAMTRGFTPMDDLEDFFLRLSQSNDPGCCEQASPVLLVTRDSPVTRRGFLVWLARLAVGLGLFHLPLPAAAQGRRRVRLAFCSQLLCVIPYEVARSLGYFAEEGLDVELVYMRGGTAAMQALVGGAVDYAATSFDVALSAFARGAKIVRFFTTGRLPLFALATSPKRAGTIRTLADLRGKTVGVSAIGNADHLLLVYLLRRAGVDPDSVRYATLGPNLFEALRVGHVDAGMVQEPAATLIEQTGGKILVNLMDLKDAQRYLGGSYEFMGVAVRQEEWEARREEMRRLARALTKALRVIHFGTPKLLVDALPKELVVGGDRALLEKILARHRRSLYPRDGRIQLEAVRRVEEIQRQAGVLPREVDVRQIIDNAIVESL